MYYIIYIISNNYIRIAGFASIMVGTAAAVATEAAALTAVPRLETASIFCYLHFPPCSL